MSNELVAVAKLAANKIKDKSVDNKEQNNYIRKTINDALKNYVKLNKTIKITVYNNIYLTDVDCIYIITEVNGSAYFEIYLPLESSPGREIHIQNNAAYPVTLYCRDSANNSMKIRNSKSLLVATGASVHLYSTGLKYGANEVAWV